MVLVGSAVAGGAHRGWPLALCQIVVVLAVVVSLFGALRAGRVVWRRTALDAPLLALAALVVLQLVVGNRQLVSWALGPPRGAVELERFPASPMLIGTVALAQTLSSFVLFLAYVGVYYLVVRHVRERDGLRRLVRTLLVTGGLLAFGGLVDYLAGESWLFAWRDDAIRGRLSASFANPDHFATWLAMLICLGGGYLLAGTRRSGDGGSLRAALTSRQTREETVKRYLPLFAIGLMLLAVAFTLSRGALVGMLAALLVLVALLRTTRRVHWSLMTIVALVAVALAYSAWIGLGPLVEHVGASGVGLARRLTQYRASLPMVRDFPILGVGLGAYKDIYPRYQPLAHADAYYPYAHSDLLQYVIETGIVGLGVFVWAVWRALGDFVLAHCLGRGACPVGGGVGEAARRKDPTNTAMAIGAIAGLAALLVHSAVEFPLRIPANGFLAAALLGVLTVAVHTRFARPDGLLMSTRRGDVWLSSLHLRDVPARARRLVGGVAVLVALVLVGYLARAAVVDDRIAAYRAGPSPGTAAAILAVHGAEPRALAARAVARLDESIDQRWRPGGGPRAAALLDGAITDLRAAIRAVPATAAYHERLASALAARAALDPHASDVDDALAHLARAIALAPQNAAVHVALFRFAFERRPALLDVALRASRAALERDPFVLDRILDDVGAAPLTTDQWLALVPVTAGDRLRLSLALERRGLPAPATQVARAALALPVEKEEDGAARWLLARLLLAQGEVDAAMAELAPALTRDPDNPELQLARAEVLRARGDARCLDAYRAAVASLRRVTRHEADGRLVPFPVRDVALRARLSERVAASPVKYRMALASYLSAVGLWQPALRELTEIVAENGRDAQARFLFALALDGVGDADRALEEYRQAVALDDRSAFRSRLAQRLWDGHQYYQAIAEWRTITERDPRNIGARLALASAFTKVGDRNAALREYQTVLGIDPASAAARRGLEHLNR